MIGLFKSIDTIFSILEEYRNNNSIIDYRLFVGANNVIHVYIVSDTSKEELKDLVTREGAVCSVLTEEEARSEYAFYFESSSRVDYRSSRLRLDNLIDQDEKKEQTGSTVVTFYSYKGGVGRSTLLSSFAVYYANKNKKVVVLDCDFEAPGLDNFFVEDQSAIEYTNGLVEFFLDVERNKEINLHSYYREISKSYSGSGEIYVFPAGNLDTDINNGILFPTNLDHYLNGLSRLNVFSKDYIVGRFKALFDLIDHEIHPDIVLIDSRTGFNDLFGIASLRFSDIVVGLFGGDIQTRPGLEYYLDFFKRENAPRLMLVNSIIPAGMRRLFPLFKDYVNNYLEEISDGNSVGVFSMDIFPVYYDNTLGSIGKPGEFIEEYISMIRDGSFIEYSMIFSKLEEYISDLIQKRDPLKTKQVSIEEARSLKFQILSNILDNRPALYGEDVKDFSSELDSGRFFFRNSMADLFNGDKFLVIGNKGTGKTYLYRSLSNQQIVDVLKYKANKVGSDYLFIPAVSTIIGQSLDTVKLDGAYNKAESDLFFERFWKIYIWSSIMAVTPFGYKTKLQLLSFADSTEAASVIIDKISQKEFIIEIEKDLDALSHYLSQRGNKKVIVAFDELDTIVKPHQWPERISPLINLCRKLQLANIATKLFLRSDLYEKITNITNKNALNNRMIRIEWTREELFAYFFNLVLSHSKKQFEQIVSLNKDYPSYQISKTLSCFNQRSHSFDESALRVLCASFFGKFADSKSGTNHRFGESYDWFYTNLKNANDTISLRPFIDLITIAIGFSIKDDKSPLPILPSAYYTNGKARAEAVDRHFKDLAQEKGNIDLAPIFDYIRNKAASYLKLDKMTQRELFELLDAIIAEGNLTENASRDELIDLLIVNGILKSVYVRLHDGTHRNFHFALLYKYYLGLHSNPKIR